MLANTTIFFRFISMLKIRIRRMFYFGQWDSNGLCCPTVSASVDVFLTSLGSTRLMVMGGGVGWGETERSLGALEALIPYCSPTPHPAHLQAWGLAGSLGRAGARGRGEEVVGERPAPPPLPGEEVRGVEEEMGREGGVSWVM